ncbi:MAG: hypothetical protein ACI8WB_000605 [Phenylobacterium sp.]|jgi:hypothetical protein
MITDDDFQEHETKRVAAVKALERADYTAAISGRDNGRIKRFGFEGKAIQDKARKEREKQSLAQALKISAAYAKLYNSTMQSLHDATTAVYEAQLLASMALEKTQAALKQTLTEASMTPDGVAVFLSQDGAAYDQDGKKLDDEVLMGVFWQENAPSWETYQARQNDVQAKQERLDLMNGHDLRLAELQTKMEDEDNPLSMDELKAVNEEVKNIIKDTKRSHTAEIEFSIQKTLPAALPDLNL